MASFVGIWTEANSSGLTNIEKVHVQLLARNITKEKKCDRQGSTRIVKELHGNTRCGFFKYEVAMELVDIVLSSIV